MSTINPINPIIPNSTISNVGTYGYNPTGTVYVTSPTTTNWNSTIFANTGYTISNNPGASIISLHGENNKEIVRLNKDGSVTWSEEIKIDEAAESFARAISLSAELKAGISHSVKLKMRDTVFEELINIAKTRGALSADDLTYLLEASKIIEKLKG